jgi:transcriptional regulator with XRE-family HTH domain
MDMRKLVGRNVRAARVERGMTQERLADVSGFSQQYISDLERGRRNLGNADRTAQALTSSRWYARD